MTVLHLSALSRTLASVALAAVAVSLGALLVAHLRHTGLSPLHQPVSQYALSSAAPWYRTQTLAMSLAALALAGSGLAGVGLAGMRGVALWLGLFAVTRAVVSWYPMDAPGAERTRTGALHGLLAIGAFASISLSANRFARVVGSAHVTQWWSRASSVVSVAMVVLLVVMVASRALRVVRNYFGLVERLFYLAIISWFVIVAAAFATS